MLWQKLLFRTCRSFLPSNMKDLQSITTVAFSSPANWPEVETLSPSSENGRFCAPSTHIASPGTGSQAFLPIFSITEPSSKIRNLKFTRDKTLKNARYDGKTYLSHHIKNVSYGEISCEANGIKLSNVASPLQKDFGFWDMKFILTTLLVFV